MTSKLLNTFNQDAEPVGFKKEQEQETLPESLLTDIANIMLEGPIEEKSNSIFAGSYMD